MLIKDVIINSVTVPITFQVSHQMRVNDNNIESLFFDSLGLWINQYYATQTKLHGTMIGTKFVLDVLELTNFLRKKVAKKCGNCIELIDITGRVECKKNKKSQKAFFKVAGSIISVKAETSVYYCGQNFSENVHQKLLAKIGKNSYTWIDCHPHDDAIVEYHHPFTHDGCLVVMSEIDLIGIGNKIDEIKAKRSFTLFAMVFPLLACLAGFVPCVVFCFLLLILYILIGDRHFQYGIGHHWVLFLGGFLTITFAFNIRLVEYFTSLYVDNSGYGEGIIALMSGVWGLNKYQLNIIKNTCSY